MLPNEGSTPVSILKEICALFLHTDKRRDDETDLIEAVLKSRNERRGCRDGIGKERGRE